MIDAAYRILEMYYKGEEMTQNQAWMKFHDTQIIPHLVGSDFDKNFDGLKNHCLLDCINQADPQIFAITPQGKLAYENEKKLRRKPLRERYWWAIAILAFTGGCFGDIGKEWLTRKIWPDTTQSQPRLQEKSDTFQNHKSVPYP